MSTSTDLYELCTTVFGILVYARTIVFLASSNRSDDAIVTKHDARNFSGVYFRVTTPCKKKHADELTLKIGKYYFIYRFIFQLIAQKMRLIRVAGRRLGEQSIWQVTKFIEIATTRSQYDWSRGYTLKYIDR